MRMEIRQITKRLLMRNVIKILLVFFACSYVSCSQEKDENSENLVVDLGKASAVIIPAPATTRSCEQIAKGDVGTGAIAGAYFTLPNPKISWKLNDPLSEIRVVVLKLSLKSPKIGGEYNCIYSDLALGSMYYSLASEGDQLIVGTWNGYLGRGTSITSTQDLIDSLGHTACPLKCGGISIPPGTKQFSVTGQWELLAVRKKYVAEGSDEFEETPIKVMGDFSVENSLN